MRKPDVPGLPIPRWRSILAAHSVAGQFGKEGRNMVRGPGIEDGNFSVFKNFTVTERARLQFRAELFNLLNHANLGLPESDLESPAFGQIL
ncbi:MAG TPA: hypothetical protein VK686_06850, partial [Bryobacteraceae bacterium]|nr:hypothetical protein [Bryobacteraceae bacterium]